MAGKEQISKQLLSCTPKELYCLQACAYMMVSVSKSMITSICKKKGIGGIESSHLFKNLLEKKLIVESLYDCDHQNSYVLDTHVYIQMFIQLAKEPESNDKQFGQFKRDTLSFFLKREDVIAEERSFILNYLRFQDVVSLNRSNDNCFDFDTFSNILPHFYEYEELRPLLLHLPASHLLKIAGDCKKNAELYLDPNSFQQVDYFFQSIHLTKKQKEGIESSFGLYKLIFSGKWEGIDKGITTGLLTTVLATAFWEQLQGNFQQAVILYEKCIKIRPSGYFLNEFFYNFAYVCALMQLKTAQSKAKLLMLSKKKIDENQAPFFAPISLLLDIATNVDLEKVRERGNRGLVSSPLVAALYELVIEHYGLGENFKRDISSVEYVLENPDLKYLRSLFSLEFPQLAEKKGVPCNELSISSLLPSCKKCMAWERTLNLLLDVPESNQKEEKSYRMVYLVDKKFRITPKLQVLGKTGSWSKGRKIVLSSFYAGIPEMSDFDREVAKSVEQGRSFSYYSYRDDTYSLYGAEALKKLIGYPYLFAYEHETVVIDLVLETPYLTIQKDKNGFVLESNISNPQDRKLLSCERESQSRIKIIEMSARQKEILEILSRIKELPLEAEDKLQKLLNTINNDITIHSDLVSSDTSITQIVGDSSIIVQILPVGDEFKVGLYVKPFSLFPPYCTPAKGTKTVMGQGEQSSVQALRNMDEEKKNMNGLCDALTNFEFVEENMIQLYSPAECLEFLDVVHAIETVCVEWPEGVRLKLAGAASASNFTVSIKGKGRWFEMVGELKYNNNQTIALHDLLEQFSANNSQRFISLGDNEYLALTEQLRKMLLSIQSVASKGKKEELKVSEFVAPLLRTFESDGLNLNADSSYKKLVKKIDKADKMKFDIPTTLQASLREYQEEGFRWMAKLNEWGAGACLADDMGLGKTVQTIAMLCHQAPQGAALVIAPASVVSNWKAELARFAPALEVFVLNEAANRSELISQAAEHDVIISTYGLLNIEVEILTAKKWKTIVLDEAHSIKNRETKISKAAMQLEGDFRLMLTGTPVQNHLSEIWNLFQFMNPGMLGSFEQFNQRFIIPIEMGDNKEKRKELKNIIAPFLLRRTKNEVLTELPGKTEIVIPVELSVTEEAFYETLRKKAELNLLASEKNSIQTLAEITRLRQAASHVGLVDDSFKEESVKMGAFFDLVDVMKENNHRSLVFSQFTSHLALFREALDKRGIKYLYLDGSTPIAERGKLVKKFQTGNQLLFLISLKAGGLGLNLTAADFIVHLDPWWNPAIEDQASDRAYRIGQSRPVTVYRLIAKNTIEEKIVELHRTKKDLANSLLDGTNQSHKLTRDELLQLLSRG
ncbi:MAG: DEAD/DEAH box helicase [Phocaeicola sp.]